MVSRVPKRSTKVSKKKVDGSDSEVSALALEHSRCVCFVVIGYVLFHIAHPNLRSTIQNKY